MLRNVVMKGKIQKLVLLAVVAVAAVPIAQAWLGSGTSAADGRGKGRVSDRQFAERISGQYFNAGTLTLLGPDGAPIEVTRGFSWIVQEDGTYIHEDSGAFETEAFFDLVLAPSGLSVEALGIDFSGMTSTGIGRWERIGPRTAGITFIKYKYNAAGQAVFVFVVKSVEEFDRDFMPASQQVQIAYYNLVDLPDVFGPDPFSTKPALTVDEMNAIVDPDPTNRPRAWFCFTQPEPQTNDDEAILRLIPVDASLSCQ